MKAVSILISEGKFILRSEFARRLTATHKLDHFNVKHYRVLSFSPLIIHLDTLGYSLVNKVSSHDSS